VYLTRIGGSDVDQITSIRIDPLTGARSSPAARSRPTCEPPASPGGTNVALFGALAVSGVCGSTAA
jgi:hypothetical protein